MADGTNIEWTDATWTPIRARSKATGKVGWHCEHASPGCINCYSETFNEKRLGTRLPFKPGHRADVEHSLDEEMLTQPLRWRRPRMVFVCSMTDLFGDWVSDAWIDRVFAVMALAPQHTFQVLTKRAERMRDYLTHPMVTTRIAMAMAGFTAKGSIAGMVRGREIVGRMETGEAWPLPNVWLGVSAEDQKRANERVPLLLKTPAAVRWVSAEPLIGPIDFTRIRRFSIVDGEFINATGGRMWTDQIGLPNPDPNFTYPGMPFSDGSRGLDWIVAGGESGAGARPMHPDWARAIRDQCATAGVAFLFKQWGAHEADEIGREDARSISFPPGHVIFRNVGKKAAGRKLDGVTHDAFPQCAA